MGIISENLRISFPVNMSRKICYIKNSVNVNLGDIMLCVNIAERLSSRL